MSVKLDFLGKCKGCKSAELELCSFDIESLDSPSGDQKVWAVNCIHEPACDMWNERLAEERSARIKL